MKLVIVVILAVCTSLTAGCNTLSIKNKEEVKLRYARICDTSGCYLAWKVVDSDGDGVTDADELMAGTDPYNPLSKPSLKVVVEVGGKAQLPSFEAGLGAFFVFPEKLQGMMKETQKNPLAAFPLAPERADTLTRLGISSDQLTKYGIDAMRDGFTIGFDREAKDPFPGRRVGGIELRLISQDEELVPLPELPNGGIVKTEVLDGDKFTTYKDGTVMAEWETGGVTVMDADGNVVMRSYVNPEADQTATVPTPEQEAALLRLRGAAIRTVEGWSGPDFSDTKPRDTLPTIILVDPEYAYNPAMVFDAPKVTTTQPRVQPDLPRPDMPANPSGTNGCTVGCP